MRMQGTRRSVARSNEKIGVQPPDESSETTTVFTTVPARERGIIQTSLAFHLLSSTSMFSP
jgi:hypothetical protein